MARVSYSVSTDLEPKVVWDALTEFGPRRAELWPDLSPESFKVLERGDNWARVKEGTASVGIWSIERYEWTEPVITATVEEANAGRAGSQRRLSPHGQHEPQGEGLRRACHPRHLPGHQRPVSRGQDTTHAREHPWVDLLPGRGGRVTAGEVNSVGGKSGLRRAGRWVTPSRGDPKESATEIKPPRGPVSREVLTARVKRWGKSPPAAGRPAGQANPVRSKTK